MKKTILIFALLVSITSYSQDHFSGITTSKRVGILINVKKLTMVGAESNMFY